MHRYTRRIAVAITTIVLLPPLSARAADGYFDASWAGGGRISFHSWVIGNSDPWTAQRVLPESNGNLLLLGYGFAPNNYFWLGELYDGGQFVFTFGVSNGSGLTTSTDIGISGLDLTPSGAAFLPGGGYLVLGGVLGSEIALVQTTAKASTLAGARIALPISINDTQGSVTASRALALQPDGKILLGGSGYATGVDTVRKLGVVRLSSNFNTDTGFNATTSNGVTYSGGIVVQAAPDDITAVVNDLLLQADGRIVMVGVGIGGSGYDLELARLNTNGTLDMTFGQNGGSSALTPPGVSVGTIKEIQQGSAMLDRAGRILVAVSIYDPFDKPSMMVARMTADGIPDTSFHGSGFSGFGLSGTCNSISASALAIDSAGRIVVAGTCNLVAGGSNFLVVRFRGDGYLDGSFGINGHSLGVFAAGSAGSDGNGIALDGGGRPIVAGDVDIGGIAQAGVARLTYDLIYTNDFEFVPRGCLPPDCL
jgi:uncharacterized delta-60 repeat protein